MSKEVTTPTNGNTQQIWSDLLQRTLDVPTQVINLDGREVTIIPHDAIRDIIHNKIPERIVRYDTMPIVTTLTHCVAKCTMTDKDGRRVEELGESTESTLETPIAKGYPATMAFQRAFDRAAIL